MKTRHLFALLAFAILLWEPTRVRGQAPTNDEPCGAFVLTPQGVICTAPTVGTTQGATETPPNGYQNTAQCGQGQVVPALDVWYQFTPGNSQLPFGATITVTGNAAGRIRLFSAPSCSGPFTEIGCSSAAAPNTTAPALVTSPTALAIPNVIFYVAVTAYGGAGPGGPFTICVTDGPGFVPCPNPAVGTPVYTSPAHTTATFSFVPGVNNVGPFTVFLRVTSSSTIVQSFPVTAPGFTISGLVPGTDYTLGVGGFCATGGVVGQLVQFTPSPANDEPCAAQPLPLDPGTGCTPVLGATRGATTTVPSGYSNPGCAGTVAPHDVWYTIVTTASGPGSTGAVITVNNTLAARQVRLFAAPSCAGPFAELACADSAGFRLGPAPLTATGLVPNTTYYISVSEGAQQASTLGLFTICASALAPALPCLAPARLDVEQSLLLSTTAVVGIVPVPGNSPPVSYTLTYAPAAGGPSATLTVPYRLPPGRYSQLYTAALLSGLLPGTAYTVTVVANCVGGGQSTPVTTTFTTLPAGSAAPPNDFCGNAAPLALNTTCVVTNASNLNATTLDPTAGYAYNNPCSLSQGMDVWFSVVVPPNGVVQVATGPISGSPVTGAGMTLYTGACGQLRQVGCSGGLFSQVRSTALVPGSTLYARVWRQGTTLGPFTVCATTDPACLAITNLVATAPTPTSATLTFLLPAGGGGTYTLTYTPTSGTAQTQPITASPVLLNNLLPGTTYTVSLTTACNGALPASANTTFTTPPVPACAPPSVVYTGNVTATSAGVGFVLNPLASGYSLTYQAAGGVVQTLAPASSPVALTGLTPGVTYAVCLASNCTNGMVSAPVCALLFSTPLITRNAALAAQVNLYPNPAHRIVALTASATLLPHATLLTLTDALGRAVRCNWVVASAASSDTRMELDLTGLLPGVYNVRLFSNAGPIVKRLIVE